VTDVMEIGAMETDVMEIGAMETDVMMIVAMIIEITETEEIITSEEEMTMGQEEIWRYVVKRENQGICESLHVR
jgi:hypothetical protein